MPEPRAISPAELRTMLRSAWGIFPQNMTEMRDGTPVLMGVPMPKSDECTFRPSVVTTPEGAIFLFTIKCDGANPLVLAFDRRAAWWLMAALDTGGFAWKAPVGGYWMVDAPRERWAEPVAMFLGACEFGGSKN